MTVEKFCLEKTQVGELCVIRLEGYIIATAWIDVEDLFTIDKRVAKYEVDSDKFGSLEVTTEHGDKVYVPCHYIDCSIVRKE